MAIGPCLDDKITAMSSEALVHLPKGLDVRRQLLVDVSAAEEHLQALGHGAGMLRLFS